MSDHKLEKQYASVDTIYSEASADVRQIRDYELNSAKWYTTILIAAVGFILAVKFIPADKKTELSRLLNDNFLFQLTVASVISFIASSCSFSINYAHKLHRQIEKYIDDNLAPKEIQNKMEFTTIKGTSPRLFQILTLVVIAVIADILIFVRL